MIKKTVYCLLTLGPVVAVIGIWGMVRTQPPSANAQYIKEQLAERGEDYDEFVAKQKAQTEKSQIKVADPNGPRPIAVVEVADYTFESMNSYASGKHEFVVRNLGTAPLILKAGGTSCRCILSRPGQESVEPGGSGIIEVHWKTAGSMRGFLQTASVRTNDPDNRLLRFRVRGSVRSKIMIEPEEVVVERVEPHRERTTQFYVYSESVPKLNVDNLQSSLAGVRMTAVEIDPPSAFQLAIGKCWQVDVTLPAGMAPGYFSETITLNVTPADKPDEAQTCELALSGKVIRRLAAYGESIDSGGVVDLGFVIQGKACSENLLLKVRDDQPELKMTSVTVKPDFVQVALEPENVERGLYKLRISIPADAPQSEYLGEHGSLRIEFDHPRIQQLELATQFAVVANE